jgi:hypothetical protein
MGHIKTIVVLVLGGVKKEVRGITLIKKGLI